MKNWLRKQFILLKSNRKTVMLFSIALILITIPFPKYSLNSQAIILGVICLLLSISQITLERVKKRLFLIAVASFPFWMTGIGVLYSTNISEGLKELIQQLPFLLIPIMFASINLSSKDIKKLLFYFVVGVFAATVMAQGKVIYFWANNLGDFSYYDNFAKFLNKHTTYYALFIVCGALIIIDDFFQTKAISKKTLFRALVFLTFMIALYMLSNRISIIAFAVGTLIIVVLQGNKRHILLVSILIPILTSAVFITSNFTQRFQPSTTDFETIDDLSYRKLHWNSVWNAYLSDNIFVGVGSGGDRSNLLNEYRSRGLTAAYQLEYNAHNQALEILLKNGIIGLLLFAMFLFYLIRVAIRNKIRILLALVTVLLLFMMTESILERHSGVIITAVIVSMICFYKDDVYLKTTNGKISLEK